MDCNGGSYKTACFLPHAKGDFPYCFSIGSGQFTCARRPAFVTNMKRPLGMGVASSGDRLQAEVVVRTANFE